MPCLYEPDALILPIRAAVRKGMQIVMGAEAREGLQTVWQAPRDARALDILNTMNFKGLPTGVTEWSRIPESTHPGASGTARVRSQQLTEIQLRCVVYSENYLADHWCSKGHIVFVVEGELTIEHKDGDAFSLKTGTTYHVADDEATQHRVRSKLGATVFIVD
jgi:hypothetical protein